MNNLLQGVKKLLLFIKQLVQQAYVNLLIEINTHPRVLFPLDEDEMNELEQQERSAEWERQQRSQNKIRITPLPVVTAAAPPHQPTPDIHSDADHTPDFPPASAAA